MLSPEASTTMYSVVVDVVVIFVIDVVVVIDAVVYRYCRRLLPPVGLHIKLVVVIVFVINFVVVVVVVVRVNVTGVMTNSRWNTARILDGMELKPTFLEERRAPFTSQISHCTI